MSMIIDGTNGLTFNNATTQASAGQVLQVVTGSTTTQVEASFASATDLGLSATITPKFSTSKILVIVSANGCCGRATSIEWTLQVLRGSTIINYIANYIGANASTVPTGFSTCYVDSPATTSATTYKLQGLRTSGSASCVFNLANSTSTSTTSIITLMEIAA